MINPTVKKYFTKFGFSDRVLQVLSDSVTGSIEDIENATEDEINEASKNYETLAKSFQSEIETRVALDRKRSGKKKGVETEEIEDDEDKTKVDPNLKAIMDRLERMEKANVSGDLNKKVSDALKTNHNLSDNQISAILHGRSFGTSDEVDEFLEAQKTFQETIQQETIERKAGSGYAPPGSKGDVTKASVENDIKSFNEKY